MNTQYDPDMDRKMKSIMGTRETGTMRLKRKFKEEPFIPIGWLLVLFGI